MPPAIVRTLRYARAWNGAAAAVITEELTLDRDGLSIPATLVQPAGPGPFPAWVALHGITRPGRAHTQLVRFTRALAAAGVASIVPEVPEWRALELSPELSAPTVSAAIRGLRSSGMVRDEPVGVIGFSFGAPHAVAASAAPDLRDQIGAACAFGGYGSIRHVFRFMMTGRHEMKGRTVRLRPDPYGRWIAAANYLTSVSGCEDATDVADALRALARQAGDRSVPSWDPVHDPVIADLRRAVAPERHALFDLFAPGSGDTSHAPATGGPEDGSTGPARDLEAAAEMADRLGSAARRVNPALEPGEALGRVTVPVHILHGHGDNLIPASESLRMAAHLGRARSRHVTVTRLLGHSGHDRVAALRGLIEVPRFGIALGRVLAAV